MIFYFLNFECIVDSVKICSQNQPHMHCGSAAYSGQFRRHCYNQCEDSLMMGPIECRNTQEEMYESYSPAFQ